MKSLILLIDSKQCVSNDINCALNQDLKISVCLPRCDTKKTCSSCTSDNSCMWCSNLNLCFDSNSYTTSFPYGQCSSWNYGSGDCKGYYSYDYIYILKINENKLKLLKQKKK